MSLPNIDDESHLVNNTNTYVEPKISQAKHLTERKLSKKFGFPEKSGNRKRLLFFFSSSLIKQISIIKNT